MMTNNLTDQDSGKMTNYRWIICLMLFFGVTINYLDRQVLSLTWKDFIAPEFHWTNNDYGNITSLFSIFYAVSMLFAGRFVDWMDTKKGFLWAIGVWSLGACLHAFCGIATSGIITGQWFVGFEGARNAIGAVDNVSKIISVSVTLFIFARLVLAVGESGNFPASIKATAEYFPKKDRAFATSIFNAGATVGALVAPATIPLLAQYFKDKGVGGGWEMAFVIIGGIGYIWMALWALMYNKPEKSKHVNELELEYIHQDDKEEADEKHVEKEKQISLGKCFSYRQTWEFIVGKFFTDGVWWFFLFWAPAYFSDQFGYTSSSGMGVALITTLYAIDNKNNIVRQ